MSLPWGLLLGGRLLFAAPADTWMVQIARMEGASSDVQAAAEALTLTARRVAEGGRIAELPRLQAQARELNRKVSSAVLASEVLTP
jgi:hypothetical protein